MASNENIFSQEAVSPTPLPPPDNNLPLGSADNLYDSMFAGRIHRLAKKVPPPPLPPLAGPLLGLKPLLPPPVPTRPLLTWSDVRNGVGAVWNFLRLVALSFQQFFGLSRPQATEQDSSASEQSVSR